MNQKMNINDPQRTIAWIAVIGAVLAWIMAILNAASANFDFSVLERPVAMLGFSAAGVNLYRLSMWADILGWYLPFLAVGGYLWRRMRTRVGALADVALTGLVTYAVLGIVGAGMLNMSLGLLADLHAGDDPMTRKATEVVWPAMLTAAQGIWNAEAPFFLMWGIVAVRFFRAEKWGFAGLLTLDLVLFGLEFAFHLCGLKELGELMLMITLLVHPLWLFLLGLNLLRGRGIASAQAEMSAAT